MTGAPIVSAAICGRFGRLARSLPLRRLGWQTTDQLVSSASNYVFVLLAARVLGPSGFGVVALVLATWTLVLGAIRALVGQPLVGQTSGDAEMVRAVAGAVLRWLSALTAVVAVASLVLPVDYADDPWLVPLAVLGIGSACIQDVLRYASFALGRTRAAVMGDSVWLAVTLLGLAVAVIAGPTPVSLVTAWGMGALGGAVYLSFVVRPSTRPVGRSIRRLLGTGAWFLLSGGIYSVVGYTATLIILNRAGADAVGTLRALTQVLAPLSLFAMSAETWGMREMAGSEAARHRALQVSVLSAAPYAAALILLIPAHRWVVVLFLGEEYRSHSSLIVPVALAALIGACGVGVVARLRVLGRGADLACSQVLSAPIRIGAALMATERDLTRCVWLFAVGELSRVGYVTMRSRMLPTEGGRIPSGG